MKVLTPQTPEAWNAYVRSFATWDVYYLCEYAVSLKLHGDGEPCSALSTARSECVM